jgi:hypothetical protein
MSGTAKAASAAELTAALADKSVQQILVEDRLVGVHELVLRRGVSLAGSGTLVFAPGDDGLRLQGDNEVTGLTLRAEPARRAVFTDPAVPDLGLIRLRGLTVSGQVDLGVTRGRVEIDGLHVSEADTRDRKERPQLSGVGVLQGGFTLWNRGPDTVTATIRALSAGTEQTPIRGSGVFVAGRIQVDLLETGSVWTDGGIAEGTADTISGGVFVITGAEVDEVRNLGPLTTRGVNDMLLDNWGCVHTWIAEAPLTSYGRSGVGFVNFGTVRTLRILAPIVTHGAGARGFNVYRLEGRPDASVGLAEFDSITTYGDAAIGVQIAQPIGKLIVHKGIHTHGGTGESLVKGVITKLSAHAISVQPGGVIEELRVGGSLVSEGEGVVPLHVLGGIGQMTIAGWLGSFMRTTTSANEAGSTSAA